MVVLLGERAQQASLVSSHIVDGHMSPEVYTKG